MTRYTDRHGAGACPMTPAMIAATRRLIGLTVDQLAEALRVNPRTVRGWESGRYSPSDGPVRDLLELRGEHDAETDALTDAAQSGDVVLPDGPRPQGWYLALAARVLDRESGALVTWS